MFFIGDLNSWISFAALEQARLHPTSWPGAPWRPVCHSSRERSAGCSLQHRCNLPMRQGDFLLVPIGPCRTFELVLGGISMRASARRRRWRLQFDTADQKRSLPKEWVAGSSAILRCCFRFADYFRCVDALKLTVMHEDAHGMRISQPHHRYSQAICATRLKIDGRNSHAALL